MASADIKIEVFGILPNSDKGERLRALLTEELGIPHGCRWFEVRFAVDEAVTVTCEYIPRERGDG